MADEAQTQPTIQTLLERLDAFRTAVEIRLDRIASEVKETHAEVYALRADFNEFKAQLKEHLPALK